MSDTQVNSGVMIFNELIHDHRMRRDNPGMKVLDVFLSDLCFFFLSEGFCFSTFRSENCVEKINISTFHRKIVLIK